MSSFVQALRMRNLFPMNSDFGSAQIDLSGPDPMDEVINEYHRQVERERGPATGLQQVASMSRNKPTAPTAQEPPLKFGGIVGPDSNPGRDILNRATANAERLYQSYNEPQITAGEILNKAGIKPNEQHPGDRAAALRLTPEGERIIADVNHKNQQSAIERRRLELAERTADDKGWQIGIINDPVNPGKQINVRINLKDGKVEPIKLDDETIEGPISKPGAFKPSVQPKNIGDIRAKAKDALAVLDQLADSKTGKLKPDTETATGYSANVPFLEQMPFVGTSAASGNSNIDRLQAMLTLDLIGEMKNQSRTGATGFGALNLRELGVLEAGASKLAKRNMKESDFKAELDRIRERLQLILQDETNPDDITNKLNEKKPNSKLTPPSAPEGYEYVRRADNKGWTAVKKGGK